MTAAEPMRLDPGDEARIARDMDALIERVPIARDLLPHGPRVNHDQGIYSVAWDVPEQVRLEFDLLTTDRRTSETHAELTVYLTDPASEVLFGRQLHRARVNLLSTSGRTTLAKYLAQRDPAQHDWPAMLEEAMQAVLSVYRAGEPAILLRDAPDVPGAGQSILPPILAGDGATFIFGDGGTLKSYLSLAIGASMHSGEALIDGLPPSATRRVAYLDWEWTSTIHRKRLARLWAGRTGELPDMVYVPCRLPLREERDRLRRIIRDHGIEYLIIDSVALAAGGEPEAAEVAIAFFGALRSLSVDALCIAHVTNANAKGSADKPFGSTFWSNTARATWNVRAQEDRVPGHLSIGLYNRKANDGPLAPPLGLAVTFEADATRIASANLAASPDLAAEIPVKVRMVELLAAGALPAHEIAERLDAKVDAVTKAVQRDNGRRFVKVPGPDGIYRIGLTVRAES